jgi:hypothetical protein
VKVCSMSNESRGRVEFSVLKDRVMAEFRPHPWLTEISPWLGTRIQPGRAWLTHQKGPGLLVRIPSSAFNQL